jgi:hypothetical protein
MKPVLASRLASTAAVPAAAQDDLGQPICETAFVRVDPEKSDAFEVGNWSDLDMVHKEEMSGAEFLARAHKAWAEGEVDQAWSTFTFEAAADRGNELSFARAAVQRFRMHDANNDGVLTQEEWETPARVFEFDAAALDERFDDMDTDDSGAISPQEYRAAGTQAVGLPATEADAAEELPVYYEFYLTTP